jgi:uncharacterized protein (TIGR00369 family)
VADSNARTWNTLQDAMLGLWTQMTGAEILRAVADGRIPPQPYYEGIGLSVAGAEPGQASLTWQPAMEMCGAEGIIQGGYIAMVLDEISGCAASCHGDRVYPIITLSISIDYLSAVRPGHVYDVVGEVVHAGKRRIVVNSRIHDPEGGLAAQAVAAVMPDLRFADRVREFNKDRTVS